MTSSFLSRLSLLLVASISVAPQLAFSYQQTVTHVLKSYPVKDGEPERKLEFTAVIDVEGIFVPANVKDPAVAYLNESYSPEGQDKKYGKEHKDGEPVRIEGYQVRNQPVAIQVYRLNYIRAKLQKTSEAWISCIFLVMNLMVLLKKLSENLLRSMFDQLFRLCLKITDSVISKFLARVTARLAAA